MILLRPNKQGKCWRVACESPYETAIYIVVHARICLRPIQLVAFMHFAAPAKNVRVRLFVAYTHKRRALLPPLRSV